MAAGIGGAGVWAFWKAAGGSAPTLSSANYTQVDPQGQGQSIVLIGTNLSGATVNYDVTPVTPSANTPTSVTFTAPNHASGSINVTVTTAGGTSNALSFTVWSPAQISGIDTYLDSNKGTSTSGSAVTQWVGQDSNALVWTPPGANRPTLVSSVFGSLPSIRFAGNQWFDLASGRAFATGLSWFFVGSTTSTFAAGGGAFDAPGNVIGRDDGSAWGGFGFNSGANPGMYYAMYDNGGFTSHNFTRGSSLNDGAVRLFGVTSDTTPNRKMYLGATQQGATDSPAGGYDTTNTSYKTIGSGFGNAENWTGDLGAVITAVGVISGSDLTKLNAWSQQRWGTP